MKKKENQRVTNDQTKLLIDWTDEGTCSVTDIVQHCIAHLGTMTPNERFVVNLCKHRLALGAWDSQGYGERSPTLGRLDIRVRTLLTMTRRRFLGPEEGFDFKCKIEEGVSRPHWAKRLVWQRYFCYDAKLLSYWKQPPNWPVILADICDICVINLCI